MVLTSKWHAKHLFSGQSTQHAFISTAALHIENSPSELFIPQFRKNDVVNDADRSFCLKFIKLFHSNFSNKSFCPFYFQLLHI